MHFFAPRGGTPQVTTHDEPDVARFKDTRDAALWIPAALAIAAGFVLMLLAALQDPTQPLWGGAVAGHRAAVGPAFGIAGGLLIVAAGIGAARSRGQAFSVIVFNIATAFIAALAFALASIPILLDNSPGFLAMLPVGIIGVTINWGLPLAVAQVVGATFGLIIRRFRSRAGLEEHTVPTASGR